MAKRGRKASKLKVMGAHLGAKHKAGGHKKGHKRGGKKR